MPQGYKVDVEKAVGHQFEPVYVSCNRRDFLLYALSVGVPDDDLRWLYELDANFAPLPTYPLSLLLKGDDGDVNSFVERWQIGGSLPGVPHYDPNKIVHGEQSLKVIRPFPIEGGRFKSVRTCTGVYDKGSGMVIESVVDLYGDTDGLHYCSMGTKMFVRGYGGWNGPKGPKAVQYLPPKRAPDVIEHFHTARNQALLYRLSGDFNPLHADPELAPRVGFPRPILHGLCSYGRCGHAIVKHFGDNDYARFRSIEARFALPVFPGETVEVLMWKVDSPDPTFDAVIFAARVKERDAIVLSHGYATLHKKSPTSSKL
ncbi:HotDog domain-containing protein [Radiomyces spectabilis]|uniref:HotDog domain-containing protein n=1 Tax=Radiomyces spectabilis TaxID=64574 RepID=UPI00221E8A77|nr:HotDog domain-containing protein [Radiomyces spectabilis]KAI8368121.1 HotDog domain-containing protein [Radiomyces spectabilis]